MQHHLLLELLAQLYDVIGLHQRFSHGTVHVWWAVLLLVEARVEDVLGVMRVNLFLDDFLTDWRFLQNYYKRKRLT